MWVLSRLVAGSATLTAAFDAGVDGLLERLRIAGDDVSSQFLRRFDDFLYKYGARCPNEMDVGSPSWETDPAQALIPIERMRLQPDSQSPVLKQQRLAADRLEVTARMREQLDAAARAQFDAALRAAALWLPARERNKFHTVVLQHEARMALLELGRRMVAANVFDAVNDYVMLTVDEFPAFLADPAAFAAEIRRRRRWVAALAELEPPFITVATPPPPSTWSKRSADAVSPVVDGEVITGIAACPGIATGLARVIDDPNEGGDLQPGEVLVAPATDPRGRRCSSRPRRWSSTSARPCHTRRSSVVSSGCRASYRPPTPVGASPTVPASGWTVSRVP